MVPLLLSPARACLDDRGHVVLGSLEACSDLAMPDPVHGKVGGEDERRVAGLERLLDDVVAHLAVAKDVDLEPARGTRGGAAISPGVAVATVETHMSVPAAAAPRAVASSPSSCAICWNAIGATRTGIDTGVPSTVVSVVTDETSTRTRGRSRKLENASRFQRKRPLVTGAAGDVAPRVRRERGLRHALGVVERQELLHGRGAYRPSHVRSYRSNFSERALCGELCVAGLHLPPLRVRREKGPPRTRRRVRKRRLAALLGVLLVLAALSFTFGLVSAVASEIPSLDPAAQRSDVDSVVYASNGRSVLAVLRGDESRVLVGTDDIAPIMRQAIVSVEDQRFFEHKGIDVRGVARALWQDVRHGRDRRGRLDDHAAVRQERLHPERADARAQGARGRARVAARAALEQGPDSHRVPQHHLLRARRVRHPAGRAHVLQEERGRARPRRGGAPRRDPGRPDALRPGGQPREREGPPAARPRR